jgi:hypothetical protein
MGTGIGEQADRALPLAPARLTQVRRPAIHPAGGPSGLWFAGLAARTRRGRQPSARIVVPAAEYACRYDINLPLRQPGPVFAPEMRRMPAPGRGNRLDNVRVYRFVWT